MLVKRYLTNLWHQAAADNNRNLARLMEKNPSAKVLDLGCDNGELVAERVKTAIGSRRIWGVDNDRAALQKAKAHGLTTTYLDLNHARLPFADSFFDVVQANQVIEHLWDTDTVAGEMYRVLKKGGYTLVATENLSAWHNLFSLTCGFQAPSQDISSRHRIANPFSMGRHQEHPRPGTAHQRIFTYFGLKKWLGVYHFQVEAIRGAGYYPWPRPLARMLACADPIHAPFICCKARK